ncbi:MAG TPA: flagellar biosynthetic protein FliR [Terriglobales bacterium]|nr:flagellar biosynthetic protein FliR [Terriglobales bacterium]
MEFSLAGILSTALVVGARVSGLMLFAPFMSHAAVPPRIKAMLALTITAVLYPVFAPRVGVIPVEHWPLLIASELLVGVAIGITTNLVFEGAEMAGQILSVQMGYSLVTILDPQTQIESNVMSVFTQMMTLLIFLSLDVHHWILRAIVRSFDYLPPGAGTANAAFTKQVLHVGGSILGVGVQIAAPVLIASVVADILLGLIGKASPQMPVMFLGPAVKGLFGLLLLSAAVHYWPDLFARLFTDSLAITERTLRLAH